MPSDNERTDHDDRITTLPRRRRKFLKALGIGGAAGLAGCLGGGSDNNSGGSNNSGSGNNSNNGNGGGSGGNDSKGGSTKQGKLPPHGGSYVWAKKADAADLNVLQQDEGATEDAVAQLFDGGWTQTGFKPDQTSPRWFESWTINDSYDVVEIKLRDNLSYGDKWGQLTAEDYIYNLENVWTADWYPYTYGPQFNVGTDNKPVKYEKTGKLTIREELPMSRPFWPYNDPIGYSYPIPKKILEPYVKKKDAKGLNKDPAVFKAQFNGNLGPWTLAEWNRQSVLKYKRNDNYYLRKWAKKDDAVPDIWAEAPYFDNFSIQLFGEESTMRSALKAGEIQEAGIAATKIDNFQDRKDITLYENPYISYSDYVGMNQRANGWEGLRNKKVRWAMANLYDREFVVKNILNGKAGVQRTLYPTWGPYYPKDGMKKFKGTVKKAKQLLKEGTSSDYGYSGDKFVGPDGNQLELKCVYQSGTLDDLRAQYLKKRLGKAGIKVTLESTKWSSLLKNYFTTDNPAKGVSKPIGYGPKGQIHPSKNNYGPWNKAVAPNSWDLMLTLGFSYGPNDPAGTVAALYSERGAFNAYGYTPSKSLEKLREKAKTASSRNKAVDTIQEMFSVIAQDQASVFESNYYEYTGYRNKVKGVPESPADNYYENVVERNWDKYYYEQ